MNTLINKINNIDINSQYVIPMPPTILSSTHFYLTGFENNEVVDIFNNFFKNEKYNIEFIHRRNFVYWIVDKPYKKDIDFPYVKYSLTLYLKNKEHIIEVFKLFGIDDIFMEHFKKLEDIFR